MTHERRRRSRALAVARETLASLALFVVAPNLIFAVVNEYVFLVRPPINLDYFIPAVLLPWTGAAIAAAVFGLVLLVDVAQSVAPGYHFSAASVLRSAADVFSLDRGYSVPIAIGLLAVVAVLSLSILVLARRLPGRAVPALLLLLCAPVIAVAEDALQTPGPGNGRAIGVSKDIATSSLMSSLDALRLRSRARDGAGPELGVPSATARIFDALDRHELPQHVVLVVVESLGLFRDSSANELLLSPFRSASLRARYEVRTGSVPFLGSTVPAELRELCRARVLTLSPKLEALPVADCLPGRLGRSGYRAIAVHGFSGSFFDRQRWYPELGFDRVLFGPDLARTGADVPHCGLAFVGICDAAVAGWVRQRLVRGRNDRIFLYWLTLNAHPPLSLPPGAPAVSTCDARVPSAGGRAACLLMALHRIVLDSIATIAMDERLPSTGFVIVGDHAPALLERASRSLFGDARVPYIALWPKRPDEADDG